LLDHTRHWPLPRRRIDSCGQRVDNPDRNSLPRRPAKLLKSLERHGARFAKKT
jgi:hypothetical protein